MHQAMLAEQTLGNRGLQRVPVTCIHEAKVACLVELVVWLAGSHAFLLLFPVLQGNQDSIQVIFVPAPRDSTFDARGRHNHN